MHAQKNKYWLAANLVLHFGLSFGCDPDVFRRSGTNNVPPLFVCEKSIAYPPQQSLRRQSQIIYAKQFSFVFLCGGEHICIPRFCVAKKKVSCNSVDCRFGNSKSCIPKCNSHFCCIWFWFAKQLIDQHHNCRIFPFCASFIFAPAISVRIQVRSFGGFFVPIYSTIHKRFCRPKLCILWISCLQKCNNSFARFRSKLEIWHKCPMFP